MGESKTSPRRTSAKLRQAEAIKLRISGETFSSIKDSLGYHSAQAAFDSVKRGLKQIVEQPAEELRDLDLRRLDAMLMGIWAKARGGDLPSIDRALKILARRAALLGLDRRAGDSPDEPLHIRVEQPEEDLDFSAFTDQELETIAALNEAATIVAAAQDQTGDD